MADEEVKIVERMYKMFNILERNYLKLTYQQKVDYIDNIVDRQRNNTEIKRILTRIRNNELQIEFGRSLLIDTAYKMFPNSSAA